MLLLLMLLRELLSQSRIIELTRLLVVLLVCRNEKVELAGILLGENRYHVLITRCQSLLYLGGQVALELLWIKALLQLRVVKSMR